MKKSGIFISILCCLSLLCAPTIMAESTTICQLTPLNLTLNLPSDWYKITRSTDSRDPVYEKIGSTSEKMQQALSASNSYAFLFNESMQNTISITMTEDASYDLSLLTQKRIESQMKVSCHDFYLYKHPQTDFAVYDFQKNGQFYLVYMTVLNHQCIQVITTSKGALTSSLTQTVKKMIDSFHFTKTDFASTEKSKNTVKENLPPYPKSTPSARRKPFQFFSSSAHDIIATCFQKSSWQLSDYSSVIGLCMTMGIILLAKTLLLFILIGIFRHHKQK